MLMIPHGTSERVEAEKHRLNTSGTKAKSVAMFGDVGGEPQAGPTVELVHTTTIQILNQSVRRQKESSTSKIINNLLSWACK